MGNINFSPRKGETMKNPIITVSEMETTQLYKSSESGQLFRRLLSGNLEKMEGGRWVNVPLTANLLSSLKVTAYGKPAKNKLLSNTMTK